MSRNDRLAALAVLCAVYGSLIITACVGLWLLLDIFN